MSPTGSRPSDTARVSPVPLAAVSRPLTAADGPVVELVDIGQVGHRLPYHNDNKITGVGLAGSNRPAAEPDRQSDGGLDGRHAGWQGRGDQRCRTRSRQYSRAGAPNRSRSGTGRTHPARLEEIAEQVSALGRRAVPVTTDITDDEQVRNLVAHSLDAYGRVDVLINNAFRVPSMKPWPTPAFSTSGTRSN